MNISVTMSEEEFEKFKLFRDGIRAFNADNLKKALLGDVARFSEDIRHDPFLDARLRGLSNALHSTINNWCPSDKVATKEAKDCWSPRNT